MNKVLTIAGILVITVSLLAPTVSAVGTNYDVVMYPQAQQVQQVSANQASKMALFSTNDLVSSASAPRTTLFAANDVSAVKKVSLSDIAGHWSESGVNAAISKGYVDGYPDGTFQPERSVSRAEFIKMLIGAMGLNKQQAESGDNWYGPYLNIAVESGIHRYEDFSQDINGAIPRLEMARLIVRATDAEKRKSIDETDDLTFVYVAAKKGLMQGLDGGDLALDQDTTRAQAITVIERVLKANAGGKLEVDASAVMLAEVALTGSNIGSMLNAKSKPLPLQLYLGYDDLDVSVTQVIVVNMADPSNPYHSWFKDVAKENRYFNPEDYIIAVHLNINNRSEKPGQRLVMPQTLKIWNSIRIDMINSSTPVDTLQLLPLKDVVMYDTWIVGAFNKKYFEDAFARIGYAGFSLNLVNGSGEYRFVEGKLKP
ncbi:S-layer homology domain-containing protein [Paenibacillus sp. WQ 127069]|uniref:S-layer homology domain-containing protein n=1 Tax=Paenibacillus baimaensis TaxID=2982185 RepID=A0ABT2UCM7_9BACL|nr:S-layer homology domain-containing protein [Paenibacillus sp. WQ 127069]MCU6792389.1 S-layer homology domain-containing protein [Paenibacillus sp. WQ 127069]